MLPGVIMPGRPSRARLVVGEARKEDVARLRVRPHAILECTKESASISSSFEHVVVPP
jgi:hypothetical protein